MWELVLVTIVESNVKCLYIPPNTRPQSCEPHNLNDIDKMVLEYYCNGVSCYANSRSEGIEVNQATTQSLLQLNEQTNINYY